MSTPACSLARTLDRPWAVATGDHVLFVIDIASRIVEVVGLARDPGGDWMKQMARNLLDTEDGFLHGKRYLILDRDPLYTKAFRQMLNRAPQLPDRGRRVWPRFLLEAPPLSPAAT